MVSAAASCALAAISGLENVPSQIRDFFRGSRISDTHFPQFRMRTPRYTGCLFESLLRRFPPFSNDVVSGVELLLLLLLSHEFGETLMFLINRSQLELRRMKQIGLLFIYALFFWSLPMGHVKLLIKVDRGPTREMGHPACKIQIRWILTSLSFCHITFNFYFLLCMHTQYILSFFSTSYL